MKRTLLIFSIIILSLHATAETPKTNPLEIFSSHQLRKHVSPAAHSTKPSVAEKIDHQDTSAKDINMTATKAAHTPPKPNPLFIMRGETDRENAYPRETSADTKDSNGSIGSKIYHFFFGEGEENASTEEENITLSSEANQTFPTVVVQGKKLLYLTFDDGPVYGTGNVLRVLQKEDIKATMFMVGRQVDADPKLFHRATAMPNIFVANHTYTHADGHYKQFYSQKQIVMDDIAKAQHAIGGLRYLRLAGRNVWRLPGVHRDDKALGEEEVAIEAPVYDALEKEGYQIFGWDTEWRFDHHTHLPRYGAKELAYRVALGYTRHTAKKEKIILLIHDYMFRDENGTKKLTEFIEIMKKEGWTFESIDTY